MVLFPIKITFLIFSSVFDFGTFSPFVSKLDTCSRSDADCADSVISGTTCSWDTSLEFVSEFSNSDSISRASVLDSLLLLIIQVLKMCFI